jgi:hypothetical protein
MAIQLILIPIIHFSWTPFISKINYSEPTVHIIYAGYIPEIDTIVLPELKITDEKAFSERLS